jgi:hypothetical protein
MHPALKAAARSAALLAVLMLAASGASCSKPRSGAAKAPRIVIVTPSEASAPREYRGAEAFVRDRGLDGGASIGHAILPDAFTTGPDSPKGEEAVAALIAQAASSPPADAIIVDPALAGSAEGLRRAKLARPGIFCVAGSSREDYLAIESSADLVVDLDRVYRAYLIPWAAKKMGAKTLAAAYVKGEDSDPRASREMAIMSAAAAGLGLAYVAATCPPDADPAAWAKETTKAWIRQYGRDTALYCADPSLAQSLISSAIAGGAILPDAAALATRSAYASALGIDLGPAKGDAAQERGLLEKGATAAKEGGRLGLWEADYGEASVEGLAEFALRVASGKAKGDELKDLLAAMCDRAPGAPWLAAYDLDSDTGVRSANRVLLRMDTYVLGSGYLQSALQAVPLKYLAPGPAGG